MKKQSLSMILGTVMFTSSALAHNLQVEQSLPSAKVAEYGEIVLKGKETTFQPWVSSSLAGKVRIVHHLAGRTAAKEKNQAVIDAIKAQHFNPANYQTTTIINADDAIVGTGMFVKNSAEKGKVENPHSQVVLDDKSAVKNILIFNRTFMFKLRITSEFAEVWCAFFVKRVTTFLTFFSHIEQHGCITCELL